MSELEMVIYFGVAFQTMDGRGFLIMKRLGIKKGGVGL